MTLDSDRLAELEARLDRLERFARKAAARLRNNSPRLAAVEDEAEAAKHAAEEALREVDDLRDEVKRG